MALPTPPPLSGIAEKSNGQKTFKQFLRGGEGIHYKIFHLKFFSRNLADEALLQNYYDTAPASILTLVTWVPQSRLAFGYSAHRLAVGPQALGKNKSYSVQPRWPLHIERLHNAWGNKYAGDYSWSHTYLQRGLYHVMGTLISGCVEPPLILNEHYMGLKIVREQCSPAVFCPCPQAKKRKK